LHAWTLGLSLYARQFLSKERNEVNVGPARQEGAKLPQGKADTERRDSVRHRCTQRVTISEEGASGAEGSGWQGTVSNSSHNGLAMVLHRRLQAGTAVNITPLQLTPQEP